MILLIDNYDSFTYNLDRYLRRLGAQVKVLRNDASELRQLAGQSQGLVVSPGPCGPDQAGQCLQIVNEMSGKVPILGICLGHQVICQAMGGQIVRAGRPIHGQAFPMQFDPSILWKDIPQRAYFARYHSLIAHRPTLPDCLRVIATCITDSVQSDLQDEIISAEVMAVEHREHPTYGVQFHPESVLSHHGYTLLANFLLQCGITTSRPLPSSDLITSQPLLSENS